MGLVLSHGVHPGTWWWLWTMEIFGQWGSVCAGAVFIHIPHPQVAQTTQPCSGSGGISATWSFYRSVCDLFIKPWVWSLTSQIHVKSYLPAVTCEFHSFLILSTIVWIQTVGKGLRNSGAVVPQENVRDFYSALRSPSFQNFLLNSQSAFACLLN